MIKYACRKCLVMFEDKDLQLSHDVPRYAGGTDLDGRHRLCKPCHTAYELYVSIAMVMAVRKIAEAQQEIFKNAKKVATTYYPSREEVEKVERSANN